MQKNIYPVIGFARSGSSLITRGLNVLGIDLGKNIVSFTKDNKWNAKGFWEDQEIIFNIYVPAFAILKYGKRGILLIDKDKQLSSEMNGIREKAIAILEKRFEDTLHYGFKNPNTSKLLPFWQSIFKTLNLKENYIVTLRNPLSSASSFSRLTKLDLDVCLLLWLMHTIPAIQETHGKKRIIVSYENMLENPIEELNRIKNYFNIPSQTSNDEIDHYVNQFLEKNLNRHPFNEDDILHHDAIKVAPLCHDVFHLLKQVASDKLSFESETFKLNWQRIMFELDKVYPLYCVLDRALRKNKELRRALLRVDKSFLWKLLYPLRWIDDMLRDKRIRSRRGRRVVTAYE